MSVSERYVWHVARHRFEFEAIVGASYVSSSAKSRTCYFYTYPRNKGNLGPRDPLRGSLCADKTCRRLCFNIWTMSALPNVLYPTHLYNIEFTSEGEV